MTVIEIANLKIEDAFIRAEKFYNRSFSRPKSVIFKRTGTNAGHCNYTRSELMFHVGLMEQEGEKFHDTYYHEVAHWIDRELYGFKRTPRGKMIRHGRTWKYIMQYVMNQDPERCHSFSVKNFKRTVVRKRYNYICNNNHTLIVSSVCHNRIAKGTHRYNCKCGGRISPKVPSNTDQIAELEARIKLLTNQIHG